MTTPVWVLLVSFAITALINGVSVARGDVVVVERITRPTLMVLLLGLAWPGHCTGRAGCPAPPRCRPSCSQSR